MSIDQAVSSVAVQGYKRSEKAAIIAGAEKEMGAFLSAVERKRGPETARRAARYWMEALDSASCAPGKTTSIWRKITIAAASRLARETVPATYATTSLG